MSQEIELKLSFPRRALAALKRHPLIAGAAREGNAATLDNTYFDTPELALKARKVAVRTRRMGRTWLQTVKCAAVSTGGLSRRPEWEQTYTDHFDFSAVDIPEVAKLLNRHHDRLTPVFTTRFRRETRRCSPREGVSILLMIDTGSIEAGQRSAPICELELELEQGKPQDLLALACELAATLPLVPGDASKAQRGYQLFLDTPVRPVKAEPVTLKPDNTVIEAFRLHANSCLRQWQGNVEAATAGHDGPEFIHQLRVALRRLRSLIKLFAPALPSAFVVEWNERLRDNANRFGETRDLDVLQAELLAPVVADGLADGPGSGLSELLGIVEHAREAARKTALHNLSHSDQGRLMLAFNAALYALPTSDLIAAVDLKTFARLQLNRLRKRARRRFETSNTLIPTQLHALRIAMKQLRYGIEFFGALFSTRGVQRYVQGVTDAQATLGFLQDVDVARCRLEAWAGKRGELQAAASFIIGWHGPRYTRLRRRVLQEVEPLLWGKTPW
ncbi:CYTH and CHAD domain-containing protein [Azoarcus sp. L1K30]|uniref:CYTH and CHAD domain-containing protein n=1 Tax=Azoarcus sp. L1K30 TaxID=2820277 RepID=UPI001B825630|nr:CYTH and CHAD domain-containing protein [Azoarcus sp. L1K30]MBR0568537.1 CYTH and CHAD domain-containing protein [Azoarcus sp. L1K30]